LTGFVLVARVLRPLAWLGLIESRAQKRAPSRLKEEGFRKPPLFEQMLSFKVEMIGNEDARH